ncbi:MAG: hypothetical protein ABJA83_07815 [Burkholderiaceae bacterium]
MLAVLVFLAKSLLEKILVRGTKQFETELKATADAEIERIRSEYLRSIESYKVQLKKSELLFRMEFEAASSFSALYRSILPKQTNPLMNARDVSAARGPRLWSDRDASWRFLGQGRRCPYRREREQLCSAMEQSG